MAGPTAVPYLNGSSAVGLSAVWRCVTLIADLLADMPWTEWRGAELLEPSRLVRRPLVTMTRREWTWRVVATEALWNTCHLLHVGGSDSEGKPWSLLPISPDQVTVAKQDPYGLLPPTEYTIAGMAVPAGRVSVIRRAPFPGVSDTTNGLLRLARYQFTAYLAADVHMTRYWLNGGATVTKIKTEQKLTGDEADDIAQQWVDHRARGADWPAVLGYGADAQPFGADPTTESGVAARQEMVADIGRYFGVPTRILNAPAGDSETYSNVEYDAVDLHRYTLRGYAGPIEDAISELLPGDYLTGRRMALDPSSFLQGSLADRATAYSALVTSGVFTAPEARTIGFGLPATAPAAVSPAPAAVTVTADSTQEVAP